MILRPVPRAGFLIGIFDGVDGAVDVFHHYLHGFVGNILTLKALRTFPLSLGGNFKFFKNDFFYHLVFYHVSLLLFHCKTYFLLHWYHLLVTFFQIYLLKILLVMNNYLCYNFFFLDEYFKSLILIDFRTSVISFSPSLIKLVN